MVLEQLVEADRDVEPAGGGLHRAVLLGEVAQQGAGGDGDVPHAALHEIAGGGGLRRHQQVDLGLDAGDLRQHAADPRHVGGVVPFTRADLGDGEVRHRGNVLALARRWSSPRTAAT